MYTSSARVTGRLAFISLRVGFRVALATTLFSQRALYIRHGVAHARLQSKSIAVHFMNYACLAAFSIEQCRDAVALRCCVLVV